MFVLDWTRPDPVCSICPGLYIYTQSYCKLLQVLPLAKGSILSDCFLNLCIIFMQHKREVFEEKMFILTPIFVWKSQ